jgi:hypothetical protein
MIKLLSVCKEMEQAQFQAAKIAVISLMAALIFVFVVVTFWSRSIEFREQYDLEAFNAMPVEEQDVWLEENQVIVSGLPNLLKVVGSPEMWPPFLKHGALVFVLTFASCWLVVREKRNDT